jgi:hypothetical protein
LLAWVKEVFLQYRDHHNHPIPDIKWRSLVRLVPEEFLEESLYSRKLTELILTSTSRNLQCLYHSQDDHLQWNPTNKLDWNISGAPGRRAMTTAAKEKASKGSGKGGKRKGTAAKEEEMQDLSSNEETEESKPDKPTLGCGHCGCPIDEIIRDFIFYKLNRVKLWNESEHQKQRLNPRERLLLKGVLELHGMDIPVDRYFAVDANGKSNGHADWKVRMLQAARDSVDEVLAALV